MIPLRFSLAINEVSSDVKLSAFSDEELGRVSFSLKLTPLTAASSDDILAGVWDLEAEAEEHLDDGEEFKCSMGISSLLTTLGLESRDLGVFE